MRLRTHLLWALTTPAAFAAVGVGVLLTYDEGTLVTRDPAPQPPSVHMRTVETMIETHRCWTGEAPPKMRGEIPGGVVYTDDQHRVIYDPTDEGVGLALDELFGHEDAPKMVTIHGFCR